MNQKTKIVHSVKSFNWNLPNKKHRNCGFPGTNYFQSFFSPVSIYHFVRNLANVVEEDFCQLNHPEPKPKTHTASQEGQELGEPELWERVARQENLEIVFEDSGMVCCFYWISPFRGTQGLSQRAGAPDRSGQMLRDVLKKKTRSSKMNERPVFKHSA